MVYGSINYLSKAEKKRLRFKLFSHTIQFDICKTSGFSSPPFFMLKK